MGISAPHSLGPHGEKIATRFLRHLGYRIIKRNYRCIAGEIDIVAADRDTLVFVEVKTRSSADATDPETAVNRAKQAQLTRAAKFFVAEAGAHRVAARFDVLAIVVPERGRPQVTHFINAFGPTPK